MKNCGALCVILFLSLSGSVSAADTAVFTPPTLIDGPPAMKGKISKVSLGAFFASVFAYRGIILYPDFQLVPILTAYFFDGRLEFLGDSLGYKDFLCGDWIRFRTRLVSISDKPVFPVNEGTRAGLPRRTNSFEWTNRVEIFLPGYNKNYLAEIDLAYSKDVSVHHGNYFELQGKVKAGEFRIPFLNVLVEPNVFGAAGWGDVSHNQYFYGPSANRSGINNASLGFWFALPELADRFFPIVQVTRFQALGDFRATEYSAGRNEGWLVTAIGTFPIFE